jgi:hypothetical protein
MEGAASGRGLTETTEFLLSIGASENGSFINGGDKGTKAFLAGSTKGTAAKVSGTGRGSESGNIGAIGDSTGAKFNAKGRILARDSERLVEFMEKRGILEVQFGESDLGSIGGNVITALDTLQMCNVWGNEVQREIVHPFIETCMICNFEGFEIIL